MISVDIQSSIATVVLDRPPVNAIDHQWVESMCRVLGQVESRMDVSVLHLRSAHKTFCAGADISLMRKLLVTPEGCSAMVDLIRELQGVLARLEGLGIVSVAEINGAAVGGGFELALACDFRVCSESAKLGLPEASLGLIPGAGGTQRLSRMCGEAVARRIILGAELVNGRDAASLGLVQWAVPEKRLESWTKSLVKRLGSLPRQALAASKRCIAASQCEALDGYKLELEETLKLYGHDDTRKRLNTFLKINDTR